MKRILLLILALVLCLGGCSAQKDDSTAPAATEGDSAPDVNVPCEDLMWAAVNAKHFSEDGSLDGSDTYLPSKDNFDALEMALWADASFDDCKEFELLEDYAILYLPYAYVTYEVAVMKADSAENAEKLLDVLKRRIDTMKAGDKGFYDANFEKIIEDAQVYREGKYAFMLITGDGATSRAAVEELMK